MKKFLVLSLVLTAISLNMSYSANPLEGKIVFVVGTPTINGKIVKVGSVVKQKDTIVTNGKSFCQVKLGDKSIIQVGKSSQLVFNLSVDQRLIYLEKGSFAAVLNKGEEKNKFVIRTPALTAGVRGTSFYVESRKNNQSYFCVCNGVIYLEPKQSNAKGEEIKSLHHTARVFTKTADGKIKVETGGMVGHDDKGTEELAAKIGAKIDWTKID